MDSKLRSLYLRMDADIQTLSDNARAQFIIKSIYTANKKITKAEIISIYKDCLGLKRIDQARLESLIDELSQKGIILVSGNHYYLSRAYQNKIAKDIDESSNRLNYIINNFFCESFSNKDIIKEWLIDAIITFFSTYSNSWISDLTSKEKSIETKKEDIIQQISNRTNFNKELDVRDRENLSKQFFSFITSRNPEVSLFLWEYGTSAFSARLVKETSGADDFTIDIFNESNCILDTNILIDIALEGSENHESLDVLSEILRELNMSVYTLDITRKEYHNKVTSKYTQIKNLLHGSIVKTLTKTNDQFMQAAGLRGCSEIEDFEIFFKEIASAPTSIGDNIIIAKYPEDLELQGEIDKYINNESHRDEYQSLYAKMHGHNKKDEPLNHDLGLIGATQHLCKSKKIFILSDDNTLNHYAKRMPFDQIPLAVRLDTLINVLAVKQGGVLNNQTSFQELFANIVRNGFNPYKDTFQVEDLSYMYDKNIQVASLESSCIEEIAREVNRLRMQGSSDKEISQALMRRIQGEKIKFQDEYAEIKDKFIVKQKENETQKSELASVKNQLETIAESSARSKYTTQLIIMVFKFFFIYLVGIPLLFIVVGWLFTLPEGSEWSYSILFKDLIVALIVDILIGVQSFFPTFIKMIFRRSTYLDELKKKELEASLK